MVEPARPLSLARKVAVLRAAVAAAPANIALRTDLVDRLMTLDRFDEVEALLDTWPDGASSYHAQIVLANCRLVPGDAAGDAAARAAADRAVGLAGTPRNRASALAVRAKAERRLGDISAARTSLVTALALDPANVDACKRLAAMLIAVGEHSAVVALTDDLLARGIPHPQVFNARAVAEARLGRIETARQTVGFERFLHRAMLDPPPGYRDIQTFNTAVAAELVAHPAQRRDPHGSASRATIRVDAPTSGVAPLATLLMHQITRAIADHVAVMPADSDSAHPWRRAQPALGMVHGTCAITGGDGFETWHIHQMGWLSGVYYVAVPDRVVHGGGPAGCIAFGLDDAFAGTAAAKAYGETLVRPRSGLLLLFPSHVYHRTFPHGGDERRICMAFDVWPR